MTHEELTQRLLSAFHIESGEASSEYLAYLTEQAILHAKSEEDIKRVESVSAMIYEKYNMAYAQYAVVDYIAKTLKQNMTDKQIAYVLNAYESKAYINFFTIMGDCLDQYAADVTTLVDAGLGIKPDKQLLM